MTARVVYDPASKEFPDRAYEIYRELRDHHPVYRDEGRGTWAISRYDDVRDAAADPETFSSEGTSISQGLLPMIQQMDPPRHHALRNLLWRAFTPRRVAGMEPRIREIARELIDAFSSDGSGDLLHQEFGKLLEERRAERRDDLMSALIDAEIEGQTLSQEDLLGFCFLLVVGGNDTTTNLIANGAVLLAREPEQRRELVRDPTLIPQAVEEMLRFESPTQALPRIAKRDVALHGAAIRAGDEVSLVWGSANHDERRFPDPERFDIHRENNRHLALGHGIHFCMGAHLARLEGRVAFEEILARMPDYALAAEPAWQPSAWARAYSSVPVEFHPAESR